jgi:hypothetical protein
MTAKILLERQEPIAGSILGKLFINDKFFCYTLERVAVAIPPHLYQVVLNQSPKFRKLMPQLIGGKVKASWGVRMHPGTTADDSDACVLVGFAHLPSKTKIYRSQEAFEALMTELLNYSAITLTIR